MKTLNSEALAALIELNDDTGGSLISEMIMSYRSELPIRLPKIMGHFAAQQGRELSFEAHAIKSTFNNFGALDIGQVCQRIEHGAKGEDWAAVKTAMSELTVEISRFEADIETLERHVNDPARRKIA